MLPVWRKECSWTLEFCCQWSVCSLQYTTRQNRQVILSLNCKHCTGLYDNTELLLTVHHPYHRNSFSISQSIDQNNFIVHREAQGKLQIHQMIKSLQYNNWLRHIWVQNLRIKGNSQEVENFWLGTPRLTGAPIHILTNSTALQGSSVR